MPLTDIKFTDGLDRDLSFLSGTALYDAQNITVFTDEGKSTGTVQVVAGNDIVDIQNCIDASDGYERTGYAPLNVVPLRSDFLVFYAKADNSGYGIIDRLVRTDTGFTRVQLYKSFNVATNLDFIPNAKLQIEVNYISEETIWVVFSNLDYPLRTINVGTASDKHLEASYTIQTLPVKAFDRVPQVGFGSITFDSLTSGTLYAGAYQYLYRTLTTNGSYSIFSPASKVVYVGNKNTGDWKYTEGADTAVETSTGVGVRCTIDLSSLDLSYTKRIEIVRLYYSSASDVPTASIIEQIEVFPKTLSFVDESPEAKYGTLEYSEITATVYDLCIGSLAVKDGFLFGMNLKEKAFDVEFDARAFRFNTSGESKVINYGVEKLIVKSGVWPNATYLIDGLPIAETEDCINPYNNDETRKYAYLSDGETLGGEGLNVKYTFEVYKESLYETNSSKLDGRKGWKQGEVYRFGLVVESESGVASPVKWIGDILIPDYEDFPLLNNSSLTETLTANYVYPKFYINTANTSAYGKRIRLVYQPLDSRSYRILSEGIVSAVVQERGDVDQPYKNPYFRALEYSELNNLWPVTNHNAPITDYGISDGYNPGTRYPVQDVYSFTSPELLLSKDFPYKNGLKLRIMGSMIHTGELYKQEEGRYAGPDMVREVAAFQYASNSSVDIIDISTVHQRSLTTIRDYTNQSHVIRSENDWATDDSTPNEANWVSGTKLIIATEHKRLINQSPDLNGLVYGRLYRTIIPYNGETHSDRLLGVYIPASDSMINAGSLLADRGDVTTSMFDCMYTSLWESKNYMRCMFRNYVFPSQSRFNFAYRYDKSFNKGGGRVSDGNLYPNLLEESNNATGDLYKYDSAYSTVDKSRLYVAVNSDFKKENSFDAKVVHSERTTTDKFVNYWSIFKPNNFLLLEGKFGAGTSLTEFNNELYFFQEAGVGKLSINPRVTQVGEDGVTTVLGTGEILERFTYLSTEIGNPFNSDIVKSVQAIYWIDPLKKKVYRLGSQLETISDTKSMHSFFSNVLTNDSKLIGIYDNKQNAVFLTIRDKRYEYSIVEHSEDVEESRDVINITTVETITYTKSKATLSLSSITLNSYVELTFTGSTYRFTCVATVTNPLTEFAYDSDPLIVIQNLKNAIDSRLLDLGLSMEYTVILVDNKLIIESNNEGLVYDLSPVVKNFVVDLEGSLAESGGKGYKLVVADSPIANDDTWVIADFSTAGGVDRLDLKKNGVLVAQSGVYQQSNYGMPNPEITLPKIVDRSGNIVRELYTGEWSSSKTYSMGDIVKNGSQYFASIKTINLNHLTSDTTYWVEQIPGTFDTHVWDVGSNYNDYVTYQAFTGTNSKLVGGTGVGSTSGLPPTRYADYLADGGVSTYDWLGQENESVSGGIIKDGVVSIYNGVGYTNTLGQRVWAKFNAGDTFTIEAMGAGNDTSWKVVYYVIRPILSTLKATYTPSEEIVTKNVEEYISTVTDTYTYTNTYTGVAITTSDNTKAILSLTAGVYKLSGLVDKFRLRPNVMYEFRGGVFTVDAVDFENHLAVLTLVEGTPTVGIVDMSEYMYHRVPLTIKFNELIGKFESFESFIPVLYAKNYEGIYTLNPYGVLYKHGVGNSGEFYGTTYDSYIDVVVPTKQLTDFTTAYFYLWANEGSKQVPEKSLHSIKVYSDEQETDEVLLYPKSDIRYVRDNEGTRIPNNGVSIGVHPYSTLYNTNKDASRRWSIGLPRPYDGERMYGSYSVVRLKFRNEGKMKQVLETLLINITK